MGYRDNCGICGESYDSDNLMDCTGCTRGVCYRCTSNHRGLCQRCGAARDAAQTAPPPAPPKPAPAPEPEPIPAAPTQAPPPPPPAPSAAQASLWSSDKAALLWCRWTIAGRPCWLLLNGLPWRSRLLLAGCVVLPVLALLHWLLRRGDRRGFDGLFPVALLLLFAGYVALPHAAAAAWQDWLGATYLLLAGGAGVVCWAVWFWQDLQQDRAEPGPRPGGHGDEAS